MDWNLTYTKKEQEGLLYENGAGEKIVSHSKLKLWTFFWDHGEREWPLVHPKNIFRDHYKGILHVHVGGVAHKFAKI